jgi:heptosyltransferase III
VINSQPVARNGTEADSPHRVLVIFPGALGDLICLGPALRAIRQRNPGCQVELMARAELARFAAGRMGVERGYSIDRREMSQLFTAGGREAREARAFFAGFAAIYSFFAGHDEGFRRSLTALAGGTVAFLPFRPEGTGHVAQGYLRAIDSEKGAALDGSIEVLEQDVAGVARRIAQLGLVGRRFVLLFPGSGGAAKNWPARNFAALARNPRLPAPPVAVLGPAEDSLEQVFRKEFRTLRGLELGEVAGLARLGMGFVGNDSGVSHLAAASGARGVVLFGPTDPGRWRPLGKIDVMRHEPLGDLPVEAVAERLATSLTTDIGDG